MWPWLDGTPLNAPIEFVCQYCGEIQPQTRGQVIVCQCSGSIQSQSEERQRIQNWQRQQEESLKRRGRR